MEPLEQQPIAPRVLAQARQEARVGFGPAGAVLAAGVLAGALLVWVPALAFVFTFLYDLLVPGRSLAGDGAWGVNVGRLARYASVAGPLTPLSALAGGALAWLRRFSARHDRYFRLELRDGEVRWGYHLLACTVLIPLVLIAVIAVVNSSILFVAFFAVLFSGFVVGLLWSALHGGFLGLLDRRPGDESLALALCVLLPRTLGRERCQLEGIALDPSTRTVTVQGRFADEAVRRQARSMVQSILRGYQRIHFGG